MNIQKVLSRINEYRRSAAIMVFLTIIVATFISILFVYVIPALLNIELMFLN